MTKKSIDKPETSETSHILGVDFGAAKIGLALAEMETKIAFAYTTLANNKDFLQKLASIIKKESVDLIIIGIPLYVYPNTKTTNENSINLKFLKSNDKSFGVRVNHKKTEYAGEKLGKLIQKMFPEMKIEYQDEMFTSKMAQINLIAKGMKGVKKMDDQEAAKIILQSWLDKTLISRS